MTTETYVVTFRAIPGDSRPAVTRLRQLLKFSLRTLRLRCVAVREVPGDGAEKSTGPSGA